MAKMIPLGGMIFIFLVLIEGVNAQESKPEPKIKTEYLQEYSSLREILLKDPLSMSLKELQDRVDLKEWSRKEGSRLALMSPGSALPAGSQFSETQSCIMSDERALEIKHHIIDNQDAKEETLGNLNKGVPYLKVPPEGFNKFSSESELNNKLLAPKKWEVATVVKNGHTVAFKFPNVETEAIAFDRMTTFVETKFRGKVLNDTELREKLIELNVEETDGIDLKISDIGKFYSQARSNHIQLNSAELTLRDAFLKSGMLFDDGAKFFSKEEYAILGFSVKAKKAVVSHEMNHALYFLNERYRKSVKDLWNSLKPNEQGDLESMLNILGYKNSPQKWYNFDGDHDLFLREMAAMLRKPEDFIKEQVCDATPEQKALVRKVGRALQNIEASFTPGRASNSPSATR